MSHPMNPLELRRLIDAQRNSPYFHLQQLSPAEREELKAAARNGPIGELRLLIIHHCPNDKVYEAQQACTAPAVRLLGECLAHFHSQCRTCPDFDAYAAHWIDTQREDPETAEAARELAEIWPLRGPRMIRKGSTSFD